MRDWAFLFVIPALSYLSYSSAKLLSVFQIFIDSALFLIPSSSLAANFAPKEKEKIKETWKTLAQWVKGKHINGE